MIGEKKQDVNRAKIDLKKADCRFKADKEVLTKTLIVRFGDYTSMKKVLLNALDGRYQCWSKDELKAKKVANLRFALNNPALFSRGQLMHRAHVVQTLGLLHDGLLGRLMSLVGDQQIIANLFSDLRIVIEVGNYAEISKLVKKAESLGIPYNTPLLWLARQQMRDIHKKKTIRKYTV